MEREDAARVADGFIAKFLQLLRLHFLSFRDIGSYLRPPDDHADSQLAARCIVQSLTACPQFAALLSMPAADHSCLGCAAVSLTSSPRPGVTLPPDQVLPPPCRLHHPGDHTVGTVSVRVAVLLICVPLPLTAVSASEMAHLFVLPYRNITDLCQIDFLEAHGMTVSHGSSTVFAVFHAELNTQERDALR